MGRGIHKLTPRQIEKAIAAGEKCLLSDGGNLYLQINGDAASWVFQYTDRSGKVRTMGLGSARNVDQPTAWKKAEECRQLRAKGIDPIQARKDAEDAAKLTASKNMTGGQCAEEWIGLRRWTPGREKMVRSRLRTYASDLLNLPIGQLSMAEDDSIALRLIAEVLKPIWVDLHETAEQLRQHLEGIIAWAMANGVMRRGPNAAYYGKRNRRDGPIAQLLPNYDHEPKHHPGLPWQQIGEFMAKLRAHRGMSGHQSPKPRAPLDHSRCPVCTSPHLEEISEARRAGATCQALASRFNIGWNAIAHHFRVHDTDVADLHAIQRAKASYAIELTVLTGCRKGMAIAARWSEISIENGIWTCSQHKSVKAFRKHKGAENQNYVIPLSKQALEVLDVMKKMKDANGIKTDYVFPGTSGRTHLGHATCNTFLRRALGYPKEVATIHGFRRTFGNWAGEHGCPEQDSEIALGHLIGTKVRNVYKGNIERIEERRKWMQAYADLCDRVGPAPASDNVIQAGRRFAAAK
jgi:integrase